MNSGKTIILLPVFNDWLPLQNLLNKLEEIIDQQTFTYEFLIVNDGSLDQKPIILSTAIKGSILNLTHNIGHQKAISIGLSYIFHNLSCDKVLIMDSDGEDRPEDAIKLLQASQSSPEKIIVGWRERRKDNLINRLSYVIYIKLFELLTGKTIRFGNFSVIPFKYVKRLIHKGDIWLHLPAGIIKSGLPYITLSTSKGTRYNGNSKMNFSSLVYHGLGALAAFIDVIALRLLIISGVAIGISLLALLAIFIIKITTTLAIPGWASVVGTLVIIIILLSFLIALFLIFTFMISQSYRKFIPALHYKEFIENIESTSK